MDRQQLEFRLETHPSRGPAPAPTLPSWRLRRSPAARWWFARMRDAVHRAPTWEARPEAWSPSHQVVLPLTTAPTRLADRPALAA